MFHTVSRIKQSKKVNPQQNNENSNVIGNQTNNRLVSLAGLLRTQYSPSLSLSNSSSSFHNNLEEELLELIDRMVRCNGNNAYELFIIAAAILQKQSHHHYVDEVFKWSDFDQTLLPALTLYLHRRTQFVYLNSNKKQIVDCFYLYVIQEYPQVYKQWMGLSSPAVVATASRICPNFMGKHNSLNENPDNQINYLSIGEWFYEECLNINVFFKNICPDKKQYCKLLLNYCKHNLSYLFLIASKYLSEGSCLKQLEEEHLRQLSRIRCSYLVDIVCL